MRTPITRLPSLACLFGALIASTARAQDPPTPAPPPPTEQQPAEQQPAETAAPEAPAPGQRRRGRRPTVVIEAGTVHPVAGPAIADGVVVIRGDRIVAIGARGEVEVPENAIVRSFPTGHVYPGLVDAATDAFTDADVRNDGRLDAPDALADALQTRHDREDELVRAGITTAYVAVDAPAMVRGQGAIVRPTKDGFELWQGRERAGVQLRLTSGAGPSHPLQRQQQQQAAAALFDGLDEWKKARDDHDEALKKYQKEWDEYLDWHRKKKAKDEPQPAADDKPKEEAKPAPAATEGETPAPTPNGRRRRGGPPREGTAPETEEFAAALIELFTAQDPPKQEPGKQEPAKPENAAPQGDAAKKPDAKDEGPKRPTYPKAPSPNPQKEVLQRVLDGELPLRVDARRPDELRAALQLQDDRAIPAMVLERAYAAGAIAGQLAQRGIPVVLTDLLPASLPKEFDDFAPASLPARLQGQGVPFAIASGSARSAGLLPMMAAAAVSQGLDADAALRAITLTPAEILGVAKDTGSLLAGKFGDVLVTDRPLFQSDSRVLLVLAKGRTEFEAN